jgi:hypothetical protein
VHATANKKIFIASLLAAVRKDFAAIPIKAQCGPKHKYSIADCLMSGLAMFSLKYSSLLQFDEDTHTDTIVKSNLQNLYGVEQVPCDTQMRTRLDSIDIEYLRTPFRTIFRQVQRSKLLLDYHFIDDYVIVAGDGTEYFNSETIHCCNCCAREYSNDTKCYYHQMMCAVIVHPDKKEVIPLCPEPIIKQDGSKKNDCERNATIRMLDHIHQEHPRLKIIFTADALAANGPLIKHLNKLNMCYTIVVKPDGNKSLFEYMNAFKDTDLECVQIIEKDGTVKKIKYKNLVPLNDSHQDLLVNFIDYTETKPDGTTYRNTWITNMTVTKSNAFKLVRAGRAKWKIENETFNTLKNQGYQFEHNFGHGYQNLSTVLALLMMLAFCIDQIQQLGCGLFRAALKRRGSKKVLWEHLRAFFFKYFIDSWEDLYNSLIYGHKAILLKPDT